VESTDDLIKALAAALARDRIHPLVEDMFGSTAEYKIMNCLIEAGRPLFMTELARLNGFDRSAMARYSKGSRKYAGELRVALERLLEKGYVVRDESIGKTRYSVNVSTLDGLLAVEVVVPRPARYA